MHLFEKKNKSKEMIRVMTAGSVDDGKSTFMGRLLYDTNNVPQDQILNVEKRSKIDGELDFSLFTDGLTAEKEQKITIDVAYRYLTTSNRRYVFADVPGHVQYTRNMATAASDADIALLLIDVRGGITEQTKRHLYIASIFGVSNIAVLVNKMDYHGYDKTYFESIKKEITIFGKMCGINNIQCIPISALKGDMVFNRSDKLDWYSGPTVYEYLENISVSEKETLKFRFPVQCVLRPHQDFRGYAGSVESGHVRVGDLITVSPSLEKGRIKDIFSGKNKLRRATSGDSVVITLEEERDISRGDMFTSARDESLIISNKIEATLLWFASDTAKENMSGRYIIKHTTNQMFCSVLEIKSTLSLKDFAYRKLSPESINLNDICKVSIRTERDISFDPYVENHITGSFILIHEITGETIAAGIIENKLSENQSFDNLKSKDIRIETDENTIMIFIDGKKVLEEKKNEDSSSTIKNTISNEIEDLLI